MYYEARQDDLVVGAGTSKTFSIPHPTLVKLRSLHILQTAGTPAAFTASLFSKEVPNTPSAGNADDFYLLTDRAGIASSANGTLVHKVEGDVFFNNADEDVFVQGADGEDTPSMVSALARRVIYLRIANAGGTQNTYKVKIGSESIFS